MTEEKTEIQKYIKDTVLVSQRHFSQFYQRFIGNEWWMFPLVVRGGN